MPDTHCRRHRALDLLAVGEVLVDFISTETSSLAEAEHFARHQGGSPANLTRNLALLGNRVALIGCVGRENLGRYLTEQLAAVGVITDHLIVDPIAPTSLVVVAKTVATPDFIAYRAADTAIHPEHIPDAVLAQSTVYHTTAFALSRTPAQQSILDGARRAIAAGCVLSIDVNYAPSIWEDRDEAQRLVAAYCHPGALVKLSQDDAARLFEGEDLAPEATLRRLHDWGAQVVCLTQGAAGSLVSWHRGQHQTTIAADTVGTVVDVTGAGDAYWAGFLTAWLDGYAPDQCARAGSNLAALKLHQFGPLSKPIAPAALYSQA